MSFQKIALALAVLRAEENLEKTAGPVSKGVIKGLKDVAGAVTSGSSAAAKHLSDAGHPLLGAAAALAPAAGAIYAGKKVVESGPVQNLKNKYHQWQYNRQMRKAQQQGYY